MACTSSEFVTDPTRTDQRLDRPRPRKGRRQGRTESAYAHHLQPGQLDRAHRRRSLQEARRL